MTKPLTGVDLDHVLLHATAPLQSLRGAHLLLTGGTGFFGKWLLETLLHANEVWQLNVQVTVLTRRPEQFALACPHLALAPGVTLLTGDVRDFACLDTSFTHVIHAATEASASLNESAPLQMFDVCVAGTRRVLELARACGTPRFLLVSSGAVYGPQPAELSHVSEAYLGGPDVLHISSAYAEGKRAAEWLGANALHSWKVPVITARAFAFVGPHLPLDAHFAAGNFLRDAIAGGPIRIGGDGTPMRSYLYAADLAVWLWHLLMQGEAGRAYNVGSDEATSIAALAAEIARLCPGTPIEMARQPISGTHPLRYVPDVGRARSELGLEVRIGLPDGLSRSLQWLRS